MFSFKVDAETELRPVQSQFVDEYVEVILRNQKYLSEWMPWALKFDKSHLIAFIDKSQAQFCAEDGFQAAIFHQGKLSGTIGFHSFDRMNQKTSIGYWLDESIQGKGVMTRSVQALVKHAFEAENLNRIEVRCGVENKKSRAIPERLGFVLEGISREAEVIGERKVDHAVYSLLRRDWKI